MRAWLCGVLCVLCANANAADAADFGLLDMYIGDDYTTLKQQLDMRDIDVALSELKTPARPNLGKRGYGCLPRSDEYADIACVSHDEKLDGVPLREIRLQFLGNRLRQMTLTAEAQHYDAVIAYLRSRFGKGKRAGDKLEWQNAGSHAHMYALRGTNLVFVSIEPDPPNGNPR